MKLILFPSTYFATVKSQLVRICTKTNFLTEPHEQLEANGAGPYATKRSKTRTCLM